MHAVASTSRFSADLLCCRMPLLASHISLRSHFPSQIIDYNNCHSRRDGAQQCSDRYAGCYAGCVLREMGDPLQLARHSPFAHHALLPLSAKRRDNLFRVSHRSPLLSSPLLLLSLPHPHLFPSPLFSDCLHIPRPWPPSQRPSSSCEPVIGIWNHTSHPIIFMLFSRFFSLSHSDSQAEARVRRSGANARWLTAHGCCCRRAERDNFVL